MYLVESHIVWNSGKTVYSLSFLMRIAINDIKDTIKYPFIPVGGGDITRYVIVAEVNDTLREVKTFKNFY